MRVLTRAAGEVSAHMANGDIKKLPGGGGGGGGEGGSLRLRVTPTKAVLMLAAGLATLLVAQQMGWVPDSGWNSATLEHINAQISETRNAMEAMKALTVQKPWQAVGQCANDLELARRELATCREKGGCPAAAECVCPASASGTSCESCDAKVAAARKEAADAPAACPPQVAPGCSAAQLESVDPSGEASRLKAELDTLTAKYGELRTMYERVLKEKSNLDNMQGFESKLAQQTQSDDVMKAARAAIEKCAGGGSAGGTVVAGAEPGAGNATAAALGYGCSATPAEMAQYLNYTVRAPCPDDWFLVQELIFMKNCFALPKRRCVARTARAYHDPLPLPEALFSQAALDDTNVRWDLHHCKDFACLNSRVEGDCRNCFNMSLESHRWLNPYRGTIRMADVIKMKRGTLRIGLDAGGGTGSFAAQMARHNVTIMTTAMNVETVFNKYQGLPYMETIALRGLIPLHWPHRARLPFFDNTLDVIHSVNSIKYLELVEFEELVMEWDRVLRPGGIMWFEMFYTPLEEMPLYIAILDIVGYKKLYWNLTPKPDEGERAGEHVYLNCVIEKPARAD